MELADSVQLDVLLLLLSTGFTALCLTLSARTDAVTEDVPDNHMIEYDVGGGEAGSVRLGAEIDENNDTSGSFGVRTTIVSVSPALRWTYTA
ncbi:MAG TPA: hypothetical protein PLJ47_15860 [Candidatus Hydrogenedentes bacterium]|nr:hypothetical protein [Candidatus Hydrogenedentota bacterium]